MATTIKLTRADKIRNAYAALKKEGAKKKAVRAYLADIHKLSLEALDGVLKGGSLPREASATRKSTAKATQSQSIRSEPLDEGASERLVRSISNSQPRQIPAIEALRRTYRIRPRMAEANIKAAARRITEEIKTNSLTAVRIRIVRLMEPGFF